MVLDMHKAGFNLTNGDKKAAVFPRTLAKRFVVGIEKANKDICADCPGTMTALDYVFWVGHCTFSDVTF